MSNNVVSFEQYRSKTEEAAAKAAGVKAFDLSIKQLSTMPYGAVLEWAGADFSRLAAVAHARDYRPEWIVHQMQENGRSLTGSEAETLAQMIAAAGPYL